MAIATKLRNDSTTLSVNISSDCFYDSSKLTHPVLTSNGSRSGYRVRLLPVTLGAAHLKFKKIQAGPHSRCLLNSHPSGISQLARLASPFFELLTRLFSVIALSIFCEPA
ncbi:hypothetical protein KOSB73_280071 [Klebsiella grimontii]|uniref:Uncharacterized protein n=2 Tax=Enterobacteriaceae TaxID=543 RepID=A0A285B6E8_9ENTR|nr:hypothetical protein KOSB73_280071 [Klebsiella grimontii]